MYILCTLATLRGAGCGCIHDLSWPEAAFSSFQTLYLNSRVIITPQPPLFLAKESSSFLYLQNKPKSKFQLWLINTFLVSALRTSWAPRLSAAQQASQPVLARTTWRLKAMPPSAPGVCGYLNQPIIRHMKAIRYAPQLSPTFFRSLLKPSPL